MCRYFDLRPVPYMEMVEIKRSPSAMRGGASSCTDDMPAPADEPQSVVELATMLNGLSRG
jgi:hypothetical protein